MAIQQVVTVYINLKGDGAASTFSFALQNLYQFSNGIAVPFGGAGVVPTAVSANNPPVPVTSTTVDANGNITLTTTSPLPASVFTFQLDLAINSGASSSASPTQTTNVTVVGSSATQLLDSGGTNKATISAAGQVAISSTGTLSAFTLTAGQSATINMLNLVNAAVVVTSVGGGCTLIPEVSIDNGVTWQAVDVWAEALESYINTASGITATGSYWFEPVGAIWFARVRVATLVSGSVTGTIIGTISPNLNLEYTGVAGSALPNNLVAIGGNFNPSGVIEPLQVDQAFNLLQFPGLQFKTGAAWTSATAINTLQFQTGTTTQGQLSIGQIVVVQLDQTTTLTAGAVTWQGTYDNINWITVPAAQIQVLNATAPPATINPYTFVASTNTTFSIQTNGFVAIRANLTSVITGTGSVTPYWATVTPSGPVQYPGGKATYRAATAAFNAAAVTINVPIFSFYGSATKVIRIQRIVMSGINSATLGFARVNLAKYSTAPTGGTSVTLTQTPLDSISPAGTATNVQTYTAIPTAGTKVGDISSRAALDKSTTAADGSQTAEITWDFRSVAAPTEIVLRGTTQGVALYWSTAPSAATNFQVEIEWTEE